MSSDDKKSIMAKINKWKDSEAKEDDFVQAIEDLYSGRTYEKVVEEGEEVTPEPITTSIPVSDESRTVKEPVVEVSTPTTDIPVQEKKQNRQMRNCLKRHILTLLVQVNG